MLSVRDDFSGDNSILQQWCIQELFYDYDISVPTSTITMEPSKQPSTAPTEKDKAFFAKIVNLRNFFFIFSL